MARKSQESLSVVPVKGIARIQPPADLSRAESELWCTVVDSKPADWFGPDTAPILVEYCRAKVSCDNLHYLVEAALAEGDPKEIKSAMQLRDMESRRLATLATKMRLTQQSRYTPQASATADKKAGGRKPWQIENK